eukprot:364360-Chlamydomonas_euryale.AAC.6
MGEEWVRGLGPMIALASPDRSQRAARGEYIQSAQYGSARAVRVRRMPGAGVRAALVHPDGLKRLADGQPVLRGSRSNGKMEGLTHACWRRTPAAVEVAALCALCRAVIMAAAVRTPGATKRARCGADSASIAERSSQRKREAQPKTASFTVPLKRNDEGTTSFGLRCWREGLRLGSGW